ncbi:MAG: DUF1905 domain-containing protein [Sphingomicrobium sp.]
MWVWSGGKASWHFIRVPENQSLALRVESFGGTRGFGSVRVEAQIGHVTWTTSVFPERVGTYLLPVKADVRRRANIGASDEVTVQIWPL